MAFGRNEMGPPLDRESGFVVGRVDERGSFQAVVGRADHLVGRLDGLLGCSPSLPTLQHPPLPLPSAPVLRPHSLRLHHLLPGFHPDLLPLSSLPRRRTQGRERAR